MIKHPQQHLEIISIFNFSIIQSTYYKEPDSAHYLIRFTSTLFIVTFALKLRLSASISSGRIICIFYYITYMQFI